jgi:hypothetical protein
MVLKALSALDARKNARLFVLPLRWNKKANRFADDLFGLLTIKFLRPLVPGCDDAVQVLADDGVVRKLDHGGEALGVALAKRLNRRAHALLQPLGQPAENAGPLALAAFEFLFAVALSEAHLDCRANPVLLEVSALSWVSQRDNGIAALQLCGHPAECHPQPFEEN